MISNKISFPDLPTELIVQILRELPICDLLATTLTSRYISNIAELVLYESVTIKDPINFEGFARTVSQDTKNYKGSLVYSYTFEIDVECEQRTYEQASQDGYWDGDEHASVLGFLPNLQHLRIMSPWTSYKELRRLFNRTLENESLPQPQISNHLKTLQLDYWIHGEYDLGTMFLQPNLEHLTLQNMRIVLDRNDSISLHKRSSSLKTLRLIDCTLEPKHMRYATKVTKSLEELEIYTTSMGLLYVSQNDEWIESMSPAWHTLKKLVLDVDSPNNAPNLVPPPLLFGKFTALKHLEVFCGHILNGGYNETSYIPDLFPPNLETLVLLQRGYIFGSPSDWEKLAMILNDTRYLQSLKAIFIDQTLRRHTRRYDPSISMNRQAYQTPLMQVVMACNSRGIKILEDRNMSISSF